MLQMDIVSGVGYDVIFFVEFGLVGMIFVFCENGISYNEIENVSFDDLVVGCVVLLWVMFKVFEVIVGGCLVV